MKYVLLINLIQCYLCYHCKYFSSAMKMKIVVHVENKKNMIYIRRHYGVNLGENIFVKKQPYFL